jgi:hypothetical protein
MTEREQFEESAMIAAMQALISNNYSSAKYVARRAQEYAIELGLVKYGEIIFAEDDIDPFTEQVV